MAANYEIPAVVEKRVRFFDGQFLQDQDFVDEQKYHVERARRHNRLLHVAGIADGLTVTAGGANKVKIAPGTAIDSDGRVLVLAAEATVDLPADRFNDKQGVRLYLRYQESQVDRQTQAGSADDTRWLERPELVVVAPGEGFGGAMPPVLLAHLSLDNKGAVTVDAGVRVYSGLRLPGPTADAPTLRTAASGLVGLTGSLTVDGNVGIGTTAPSSKLHVNGDAIVSGALSFGSTIRQMINLWSTGYGIGVQNSTQYFRTDKNFAWYKGGSHHDGELNAGANGAIQMVIKDGKVGIGTADPGSYHLNVNGDLTVSSIRSKPQTFSFKVEGSDTEYYPVVFSDDNWADGAMTLEIVRPNVHTDAGWKGALMSRFVCHSTNYGHGADFLRTEIYQSQTTFIAGYENERRTAKLIVWLKGNTTYSWRANHFVTLSDYSATAKTISDKAYPVKQAVESYVRSGSVNLYQGLQVDGNVGIGTASPVGRLDVRGSDYQFTVTNSDKNDSWGLTNWDNSLYFQYRASATGTPTNRVVINKDGNVGIGITSPRTALDTGLGVMSGAANDYQKAQFAMSGGGTVTWGGAGGRLKWSTRFIAISMERAKSFTAGHINIKQPTTDIPKENVYDGAARSATAEGVLLKAWEALYAVHTVGGNENAVSGFQIRSYTQEFYAPSNWLLVAVVNGDDNTVKLGTGVIISASSSFAYGSAVPSGAILLWRGATNAVPTGWALCDGGNGTPDLRDRFVVGAGAGYAVDAKGGSATHTLTLDEIPSHNHNNGIFDRLLTVGGGGTVNSVDNIGAEPNLIISGTIVAVGGGKAHENRPPYWALAYIMKL